MVSGGYALVAVCELLIAVASFIPETGSRWMEHVDLVVSALEL